MDGRTKVFFNSAGGLFIFFVANENAIGVMYTNGKWIMKGCGSLPSGSCWSIKINVEWDTD